jgi:hypothetical protein
MRMSVSKKTLALLAALLAIGLSATVAGAQDIWGFTGWKTKQPAMIAPVKNGVVVEPLLTVGERLRNGYMFESIPDGIAYKITGDRTVDVYVNHETSTVPFPFDPATGVGLNDFTNAMLSKLTLHRRSGSVQTGSLVIPSEANYQRFCSNFMAGPEHGLDRYLVFTNEEAVVTFNRTGVAYPLSAGGSNPEVAGVVVAYDVDTGEYRSIHRMGRHNHENSVALPGYDQIAVLSGDDTFVSNPPNSQLYLYTSPDTDTLWNDGGQLWAFKANVPTGDVAANWDDYYDIASTETMSGTFIPVPDSDDPVNVADGDQAGLESWSQANGVFDFVRIEDIAYDRTDPTVVYLADSGRGGGLAPNGRIWRMQLDDEDPTVVVEARILLDFDAGGTFNPNVVHQPDNLETTANSLLITEDPSTINKFHPTNFPNATAARLWRYDFDSQVLEPVVEVDQSLAPTLPKGEWESSGVVDASRYFGPGAFLITVQAHSYFVGDAVQSPYVPELQRREGGQLLLVRIEGA